MTEKPEVFPCSVLSLGRKLDGYESQPSVFFFCPVALPASPSHTGDAHTTLSRL